VSDLIDLMNPEAVARLRHSLRTPLNELIGHAEMVRGQARDQSAAAEAALMEQTLAAARRMADRLEQFLPVKSHIAEDAVLSLRVEFRPLLDRVETLLASLEALSGDACAQAASNMRSAARELRKFAPSG
jgi:signal transduction histidine kinase